MADNSRARLAHAIREASGLGLQDVLGAMKDAEDHLGGDYVLAALVRHAHGFAISVKSENPDVTPAQARRDWDIRWARSAIPGLDPGQWNEVRRLCDRMQTHR